MAAVNNFQGYTQLLHHRRASAAEVMRCPLPIGSFAQHQRIVMVAASKGLAAIFEAALVGRL